MYGCVNKTTEFQGRIHAFVKLVKMWYLIVLYILVHLKIHRLDKRSTVIEITCSVVHITVLSLNRLTNSINE